MIQDIIQAQFKADLFFIEVFFYISIPADIIVVLRKPRVFLSEVHIQMCIEGEILFEKFACLKPKCQAPEISITETVDGRGRFGVCKSWAEVKFIFVFYIFIDTDLHTIGAGIIDISYAVYEIYIPVVLHRLLSLNGLLQLKLPEITCRKDCFKLPLPMYMLSGLLLSVMGCNCCNVGACALPP